MITAKARKQKFSLELQTSQPLDNSTTNGHFQKYQKLELVISIGKSQPVLALILTIGTFSAELHSQFSISKDTLLFELFSIEGIWKQIAILTFLPHSTR